MVKLLARKLYLKFIFQILLRVPFSMKPGELIYLNVEIIFQLITVYKTVFLSF